MKPHLLLTTLCYLAVAAGIVLYKGQDQAPNATAEGESARVISRLQDRISELEQENESLRRLAETDQTISVPPELISFIEDTLTLKHQTTVPVYLSAEGQLREIASNRWFKQFGEDGMALRHYALEKLGIIPVNQNLVGQLIEAEVNGAIGILDNAAGEIHLRHHFDAENVHHQADLVRLHTLALLNQHYPPRYYATDDAWIVAQSLHRGLAAMVQEKFYTLNARHLGFHSDRKNAEVLETFRSLCSYAQELTTFPSREGKSYMEQAWIKNSQDCLNLFQAPPRSTQLLLSAHASLTPRFKSLALKTQLDTRLGLVAAKAYLSQTLDESQFSPLLSNLHQDRLVIRLSKAENPLLITQWITQWNSKHAAASFAKAAVEMNSALSTPPTLDVKDTTVILTFSEPAPDESSSLAPSNH